MVLKYYEFTSRCKKTRTVLKTYHKMILRDLDKTTAVKSENTIPDELNQNDSIDFDEFNDNSNDRLEISQDCDKPEHISAIKIELYDRLNEHFTNIDGDKLTVNSCGHCSESFTKRNDLNKHLKTIHKDKTLVCDVCGQSFTQIQTLKRHSKIHQSDQKNKLCPFCGKCFVRSELIN